MKKVFFALMFLSIAGAGVLFWLIRSAPASLDVTKHEAPEAAGHGAGAHIVEEEKHGEEKHGEEARESASTHESTEHAEAAHGEVAAEHEAAKHAEAAPEHAEEAKTEEKVPASLSIATEPAGAKVWVDGKERGVSPIEIPLLPKAQMVQIEAEGYEDFTRSAPAESEGENGAQNWKIQLKKKAAGKKGAAHHAAPVSKAPVAEHQAEHKAEHKAEVKAEPKAEMKAEPKAEVKAEPKVAKASDGFYAQGRKGPQSIQLKSVSQQDMSDEEFRKLYAKYKEDLAATLQKDELFACKVEVKGKGQWTRILVGPFGSKAAANERLAEYRKFVPDAYLAGTQKCSP